MFSEKEKNEIINWAKEFAKKHRSVEKVHRDYHSYIDPSEHSYCPSNLDDWYEQWKSAHKDIYEFLGGFNKTATIKPELDTFLDNKVAIEYYNQIYKIMPNYFPSYSIYYPELQRPNF